MILEKDTGDRHDTCFRYDPNPDQLCITDDDGYTVLLLGEYCLVVEGCQAGHEITLSREGSRWKSGDNWIGLLTGGDDEVTVTDAAE